MVMPNGVTVKDCDTLIAGLCVASPACEAVIVVVPAPTIIAELPEIVATFVFELIYVIGFPPRLSDVANNGTLTVPYGTFAKAGNVITWSSNVEGVILALATVGWAKL